MKKIEVTAKVPEKRDKAGNITQNALGPATVSVDYPETLDEGKKMFGEEPILTNALANFKVTIQGSIRTALKHGEDQASIQARLGQYKMGVAIQKGAVDSEAAFLAKFQTATAEERKAMIKKLQNISNGK